MKIDRFIEYVADVGQRLAPLRERLPLIALRQRAAVLIGAILLGLAALLFAKMADGAQSLFRQLYGLSPFLPFVVTPLTFAAVVWMTRRFVPDARGSGIPQVIAASTAPTTAWSRKLISLRTAMAKITLTLCVLLGGGTAGREGPTVQVSAAIMAAIHRRLGVRLTPGALIAGGAAGVAAAFNTPLAGIAFAIEELASSYEQRVTIMVMGAVMIAGLVSLGIAGDYVYFGRTSETLTLLQTIAIAPVAGIAGGLLGGLFARILLAHADGRQRWSLALRSNPLAAALACGLIVAALGYATQGMSFGTGYRGTRALLAGDQVPYLFGPAKFLAAIATAFSGAPGGIFAPSLAVGAGLGQLLSLLFPASGMAPVVLLGMTAYFVGVVRAPFTAVIIVSETTGNHGAILALFATALIADAVSAVVCPTRLYHGLAKAFVGGAPKSEPKGTSPAPSR